MSNNAGAMVWVGSMMKQLPSNETIEELSFDNGARIVRNECDDAPVSMSYGMMCLMVTTLHFSKDNILLRRTYKGVGRLELKFEEVV